MTKFFVLLLVLCHHFYPTLLFAFRSFSPNGNKLKKLRRGFPFSNTFQLNAKKKPKLVSDEFLSSLTTDIEEKSPVSADPKLSKLGLSPSLLDSIDAEMVGVASDNQKSKKKKKNKSNKGQIVSLDDDDDADVDVDDKIILEEVTSESEGIIPVSSNEDNNNHNLLDAESETIEQRVRKEKPPSRVRFAESSQPDYVMMGLEKVGLMYGNQVVLKDATFSVSTGERVGLVGPNGGGKTTQLRILAGEVEATTGDVIKSSRNLRVAFLRQEFVDGLGMTLTLREELLTSFVEEKQLLQDISDLEEALGKVVDDEAQMTDILDRLQGLQEKAISKGVYSLDSKVDKIMDTMGFSSADASSLVESFSGGWKMRIGLAKILLQDPNVLLLDEPTNHLDLDSGNLLLTYYRISGQYIHPTRFVVFWLEDFLQKQKIPMVIVSHDREFLDRVCNKIVDVEEGVCVSYTGNYSKFLEQKRLRLDQWREQYDKQMRYVKEEEKWIKAARSDPNMAQQLRAKEMALEKFQASEEYVQQPPKDKKFRFRFPPAPRCGQNVVEASKLSHGYGDGANSLLFESVELQVDRGERIGFVGPNGAGKFLKFAVLTGFNSIGVKVSRLPPP